VKPATATFFMSFERRISLNPVPPKPLAAGVALIWPALGAYGRIGRMFSPALITRELIKTKLNTLTV